MSFSLAAPGADAGFWQEASKNVVKTIEIMGFMLNEGFKMVMVKDIINAKNK